MNSYFDENNGFALMKPCENHGRYYCDERGCKAARDTRYDFISGPDPGDDEDFIDKHKSRWPKYEPQ